MTLIYLLNGKRHYFGVPDPLSEVRFLMDETMWVLFQVVLEQVAEVLTAISYDIVRMEGATARPPVRLSVTPQPRIMENMQHFRVEIRVPPEAGYTKPILRRMVQNLLAAPPRTDSLLTKFRRRYRSYRDRDQYGHHY